jgi:hypothetical protein
MQQPGGPVMYLGGGPGGQPAQLQQVHAHGALALGLPQGSAHYPMVHDPQQGTLLYAAIPPGSGPQQAGPIGGGPQMYYSAP